MPSAIATYLGGFWPHDKVTEIGHITRCIRAKHTKISEVNLSAFIYRVFHVHFSPVIGMNTYKILLYTVY